MIILLILYFPLGFWAANKTIYANRIMIGDAGRIFMQKFITVTLFGWALIPLAILRSIFKI